ncbi:MAG TPA: YciI family protein [Amycolatopsis sp.]|jgi:uncharacterized protein YciI|nr:YciI family protein [Amycolatopsis sp.]
MAWYLVEIRYVTGKVADVRPRHREWLNQRSAEGSVVVAGPFADDSGGLVLWQAEDETALKQVIDQDPYQLEGVIAERTVREYKPVIGAWVPQA